ncbi:MAG: thiamine diphosphokinase [Pseudomonadota bacterium]
MNGLIPAKADLHQHCTGGWEAYVNSMRTKLHFETPVTLIGGGAVDADGLATARALAPSVVAADGGADHFTPGSIHGVIGDMDSITDPAGWQASPTPFIPLAEQDSTDFEKCLYSVAAPLVIGLGFLGCRLDHSLAALHVLLRYAHRRVVLVGEGEAVFLLPPTLSLTMAPGALVSLVPLRPVTATASEGLRWPVDGFTFELGRQSGTSNELIAERLGLEVAAPGLLAMVERRYLPAVSEALDQSPTWDVGTAAEVRP